MKRTPLFYKTEEVECDLTLTTRTDKLGNIFHCVGFLSDNSPSGRDYVMFSRLDSALDFIKTNFR